MWSLQFVFLDGVIGRIAVAVTLFTLSRWNKTTRCRGPLWRSCRAGRLVVAVSVDLVDDQPRADDPERPTYERLGVASMN
jgi:hypothetical protein